MYRVLAFCIAILLGVPCCIPHTSCAQQYDLDSIAGLDEMEQNFYWMNEYNRHKSVGNYAKAQWVMEQAWNVVDRLVQEYGELAYLERDEYHINYCDLLCLRGEYVEAEKEIRKVETPELKARYYTYLSNIYMRQGKYEQALAMTDSCMSCPEITRQEMAIALQNKGYILNEMGNHRAEAVAAIESALTMMEPSSDPYAIALGNLAVAEARSERYDEALAHVDKAIAHYRNKGGNDYVILIRKRAEILLMKGDRKGAENAFMDYYRRERAFVTDNFYQMTEQKRLDFWKTQKPLITEIFALEAQCPDSLFEVSVFCREVAMLGNLDAADIKQRLSVTGRQVRKQLKKGELLIDFVRYEKEDQAWYGALVVPSSLDAGKVSFIPLWPETELHGLKVGDRGRTLYEAVCSFENSNPRSAWQPWMTDKNDIYNSDSLAAMIWKPLTGKLKGVKRIYFAPDGLLQMLAVEYLIERAFPDHAPEVRRITSPSVLTRKTTHPYDSSRWLIVTALDYNRLSGTEGDGQTSNHEAYEYVKQWIKPFRNMQLGRNEHDSLKLRLPAAIDSVSFSEESAKSMLGKYPYVFLSTHGYSMKVEIPPVPAALRDSITEDKSLLASGILCSGGNIAHQYEDREDGFLSARELCDLDLSQLDLIILSACQTAEGKVSDEGPAGVVRGLKKAGARTIIATLWPVNELTSLIYMLQFFDSLEQQAKAGKTTMDFSKAVAAARAKIRNLNGKNNYNQPYYWAPYIVIDDCGE